MDLSDISSVNSEIHPNQKPPTPQTNRWQRLGLRTQLALVFGSLVVLLAIGMSIAFAELLRWRVQREAAASLNNVASNASRLLADGLFSQARSVQVLASSADLWNHGLSAPGVNALLTRLQSIDPANIWIGVTDTKGMVRSATGGLLVNKDASDRAWFQNGIKAPYVGDVRTSFTLTEALRPKANSEPYRLMDFSAPIRLQGKTIGVFSILSNWDWARETVEGLLPANAHEKQISLFIFDRNDQLIYGPGGSIKPFLELGQQLPFKIAMAQSDSRTQLNHTQIVHWKDSEDEFLTAIVPLQPRSAATDMGWHIVARQPLRSAYAPAWQAMYKVLAGGLFAALLAAAIAWLAARRLSHDLKNLAQAAHAIHDGDNNANIPLSHGSQEISHLSSMLRSSIDKLRAANEAMEAQVAERTQQLQQANAELEQLARRDPLTGLLNRRGFESQMQFAIALSRRSQRPLSALAIDIDFFKRVNDSFGHDVGDAVLRSVSHTLRSRLRDSDVLARMGGEEFTILLPDTTTASAMELAEQLRSLVASQPMEHGEAVTISIGISSLLTTDKDNGSAMLRRGDEALYAAKAAGRNTVVNGTPFHLH